MPLSPKGKKILKKFQELYGKEEGKRFFYASIVKGKIPHSKVAENKGSGKLLKAKKTYQKKHKK
jgi:hypothetical protein